MKNNKKNDVSKRTKEQSWLRQSADEADLEMVNIESGEKE